MSTDKQQQGRQKQRVMIMAAGTGGHIFPGIAIAREMIKQQHEVIWLGTQQGMENTLVPRYNIPLKTIMMQGVRGKSMRSLLSLPWKILKAIYQAYRVILLNKPDVVVGMGGYVSAPGGIAARLSGKKLIIHEQNAIAGMSNKLLNLIAHSTLCAFPQAAADFYRKKTIQITGNPVRQEIIDLYSQQKHFKRDSLKLLVVGGSLGATSINALILELAKALQQQADKIGPNIEIKLQCGKAHYEDIQQQILQHGLKKSQQKGFSFEVMPFIDDMPEMYKWCDVIICRAGALTVSELAVAGIPSILIPYPFAVDDHQTRNAASLVEAGAAVMIQQSAINLERLIAQLQQLKPECLADMHRHAKQAARVNALQDVTRWCLA